ncbi:MAG: hypothetical protein UR99_C0017G0017 [Candidatus Moranbacteria bacterium GW2011_GWD2_36_12]|nr:MAG: hypothetical protein UR99_C0017G0017 [Candidatus Moranbacteria bacterium GW2011_GWD2_36_12]
MICVYQLFPVKDPYKKEGKGDCFNCTPDERNADCEQYIGASEVYVEVKRCPEKNGSEQGSGKVILKKY